MRVLQVSKYYAPVTGGIESAVQELTEGLNRIGCRTDVLCANLRFRTSRETTDSGYQVVRAASAGTLMSTSMAPQLVPLLRRMCGDYDVIDVHMPNPLAALAVWCAQPQAKLVVHWHSDVVRQRAVLKLYEPLQAWLLGRADAVVATTSAYAEASSALSPWKAKTEIIPIGVSDRSAQVRAEALSGLRQHYGGRRIVFALGRMTYYKGFDVLIEAARELPDDCVVVIGGSGRLLPELRAQVRALGLGSKVDLPGQIAPDDLLTYMALAEVFCLPSTVRAEAYGLVMLEAMAMGKPVLATDIPGSGVTWVNQNGSTGLNVEAGSASALAAGLCAILGQDALRQRMGRCARERYVQEFGAESMTHKTLDLYRRLH